MFYIKRWRGHLALTEGPVKMGREICFLVEKN